MRLTRVTTSLIVVYVLNSSGAVAAERFPFVIPGDDATSNATDFSYLSHQPAGAHGFVRVRDGHFTTDAGRLRVWGVNVCFGGNFPAHGDAEKVAAHLAKLGINGVRFHHLETRSAPHGILAPDGTFDPDQVDRFDYFLAQLHQHGIYANINLHVGNAPSQRLGLPSLGTRHDTQYDKFSLHFQPEIQREVFGFWRELMTHVNPYRQRQRSDDPAIAMVEMTNENRFALAGPDLLQHAPEPYRSTIRGKWNAWLKARYSSSSSLRTAWKADTTLAPQATIVDSARWGPAGLDGWRVSDHGGKATSKTTVSSDGKSTVLGFASSEITSRRWHQQLSSPALNLEKGRQYTLQFSVRAGKPRQIGVNIAAVPDGQWHSLGLARDVTVTAEWKKFSFSFQAHRSVHNDGRIAFDLGGSNVAVELKDVLLRTGGGLIALPAGQSIEQGNVDIPNHEWVTPAQAAFGQFMHETERAFYRQSTKFLRDELGVRVPITTTQANYQPLEILAEVADYADMHAYWHHPIFQGKAWDRDRWTVQNEPLVAYPFHNKWPRVNLLMRTPWRLHGKPFTLSEWNAGEPGFFSASAVPLAALLASLQDWDAVFFFNYHSARDGWNTDRLTDYFSINGQPVKSALIASCANLYRRGDLPALQDRAVSAPGQHGTLGALALRYRVGLQVGIDPANSHVAPRDDELIKRSMKLLESPDKSVRWDARDADTAHVSINTPSTRCVWGLVADREFDLGGWKLRFGATQRDYGVFIATSRDGKSLEESKSILITVLGNAENQNMGWNDDRTSVGRNWGQGPTVVNGVPVRLVLPASQKAKRLFALDGRGQRIREVPVADKNDASIHFNAGPKWQTIWYELADLKTGGTDQ